MITYDEFDEINKEVLSAVQQLLDQVKLKSQHYILFLANGEFIPSSLPSRLNPYAIDSKEANHIDLSRRRFLSEFMDHGYCFPDKTSIVSSQSAIIVELMIYTHIWESKPFLTSLYRLTQLVAGKSYPWQVDIPWSKKEDFIRKDIRDQLNDRQMLIGKVQKGFILHLETHLHTLIFIFRTIETL